jgi:formylglycine-generating enzyme required for sulfatase activity
MVRIGGGTFRMGSDVHYPGARPAHDVTVDSFWIDRHAVTSADFAAFVSAIGYVTFAARRLTQRSIPACSEWLIPAVLCSAYRAVRFAHTTCAICGNTYPRQTGGIPRGWAARSWGASVSRLCISPTRTWPPVNWLHIGTPSWQRNQWVATPIGTGTPCRSTHTRQRQTTEMAIAVRSLNRMLELGRPNYVRIV